LRLRAKSLGRGQETLLQADDEQPSRRLRPACRAGETLFARRAVLVEEARQREFRRVAGEPVDHEAYHVALREPALNLADIFLEPTHHHVFQCPSYLAP
jgi:hypothetical protein